MFRRSRKNRRPTSSDVETVITSSLTGNEAQKTLNETLVNDALSGYTKNSIEKVMQTLKTEGKPSSWQDAIEYLAEKNTKGRAFEGIVTGEHIGSRMGRTGFFGVKGSELSPTNTDIDNVLKSKNYLNGQEEVIQLQAKSSEQTAIDAIGNYNVKVIVPVDVFNKLKNNPSPKVQEAFNKGFFIKEAGGYKGIDEQEAIRLAKHKHERDWRGDTLSTKGTFDFKSAGQIALIGGSIRIGFSLGFSTFRNGKITKKDLENALLDGATGFTEAGGRALVAQGLSKSIAASFKGAAGRWVGRTAGAGAGLILATAKDIYSLSTGDITLKEFGTRGAWNFTVFVATSISGPLGLGVAVTRTIYDVRKMNSKERNKYLMAEMQNNKIADANFAQTNENLVQLQSRMQQTKQLQQTGINFLKKGSR